MKDQSPGCINRNVKIFFGIVLAASLSIQLYAANVLTQHNDLARTGANISETILTPANVNSNSFGQLFSDPVDGQVYAQPLYVDNLSIAGGKHNVVFVCTENNSVYALDADTAGITYWQTNLGIPFPAFCGDLTPTIGITGTPVIDLITGTLYVSAKVLLPAYQLHALDLATGNEKFGGPATVAAPSFNIALEFQRPGLALANGVVYLTFGSHCDVGDYHGFIIGYNAANLSQVSAWNTSPTGIQAAIWSGGMAPAVDAEGNLYVITSNGSFDGTNNFGESFVKLNSNLVVQDYATPINWSGLNDGDVDLGSGGPVFLPPHYVVGMGKDGIMYLADANDMGEVGNFAQTFQAQSSGATVGKSPVYWQGPTKQYLFAAHAASPTKSFEFTGSNIVTTALGTADFAMSQRCGGISLSANGTTNGILWEQGSDSTLRAYDAVNFPQLLWSGSTGTYVKMTSPTIADGKVFEGNMSELIVWGLTNFIYIQSAGTKPVLSWATGTLQQASDLSGPWVTNPEASPCIVEPTNTQMFYRLVRSTGP